MIPPLGKDCEHLRPRNASVVTALQVPALSTPASAHSSPSVSGLSPGLVTNALTCHTQTTGHASQPPSPDLGQNSSHFCPRWSWSEGDRMERKDSQVHEAALPSETPGTTVPIPFPPPTCCLAMPTSAPGNSVVPQALSLGKPMAALSLAARVPRGACGGAAQAHRKAPSVGTPGAWECLCPVPAAPGARCPLDSLLKPLASPS